MNKYSSKNHNKPQTNMKGFANYLLKKPKPNSIESPNVNFQTISSFYLKQKINSIQSKHGLTNSMANIGVIKALNQSKPYLNHSSSKSRKSDLCITKPLSNPNSSVVNEKTKKYFESSMNILNNLKEEKQGKNSLIKGLKNNLNKNKMKLKQILKTNVSQDYSIINENLETSPNNRAILHNQNPNQNKSQNHNQCRDHKYNTLSNVLSIQLQQNETKKHFKTNSLYIDTGKDNEYIPKAFRSNNNHNSNFFSSSRVNCVGNSNNNNNTDTTSNNNNCLLSFNESNSLGKIMAKLTNANTAFNSKTKKYNFIKTAFEELIALYPIDHQDVLTKIEGMYHEMVFDFAKDNKKRKEENETNAEKIGLMEIEVDKLNSELQKKEIEIELLKKRIREYEKSNNPMSFSKSTASSPKFIQNISEGNDETEIENIKMNNYFLKMKQKNFEDLDSLYFFDKVPKGSILVSNKSIPLLRLDNETIKKTPVLNSNHNNKNKKVKGTKANINDNDKDQSCYCKDKDDLSNKKPLMKKAKQKH